MVYEMRRLKSLRATIKNIYKPKYVVLNLLLGILYAIAFWYLAYIQGGNAVMLYIPIYLIFLLISSSSILTTTAIYSIRNTRKNNAKTTGTIASAGTVLLGSGLCGCTTTLLPVMALTFGVSTPAVYALSSFLKNFNIEIISVLIIINLVVLIYYLDKLSNPLCHT